MVENQEIRGNSFIIPDQSAYEEFRMSKAGHKAVIGQGSKHALALYNNYDEGSDDSSVEDADYEEVSEENNSNNHNDPQAEPEDPKKKKKKKKTKMSGWLKQFFMDIKAGTSRLFFLLVLGVSLWAMASPFIYLTTGKLSDNQKRANEVIGREIRPPEVIDPFYLIVAGLGVVGGVWAILGLVRPGEQKKFDQEAEEKEEKERREREAKKERERKARTAAARRDANLKREQRIAEEKRKAEEAKRDSQKIKSEFERAWKKEKNKNKDRGKK